FNASIAALKGRDAVDIFILHPEGRVSEVQRRQMTSVLDPNVHNIAVRGSFDDCQNLVKAMFNNADFRNAVRLSAVNSINWARIMAQIVYYFTSAAALGAPGRPVTFSVPTGNFGDIYAGYAAKQMGLPVDKLIVATNVNDILDRTLKSGRYEMADVTPSTSPSMDIQISSNFERALFEALDRDAAETAAAMASLRQSGAFSIPEAALTALRGDFASARAEEGEVARMIAETSEATGLVVDPHTACGLVAADKVRAKNGPSGPMVTLATAHPAKFPSAVEDACGVRPALPAHLGDLLEREERMTSLDNNQASIEAFIAERSRAG
ncbi:MAG: threonine synthase, partial [Pseudomonadota bacterium]